MLDGVELKDLKLRWLRSQIGLVSQEPALFATSIRENLLLGREEASQVEMEEAARVANAHSFIIKLPDGYDTQVRPLVTPAIISIIFILIVAPRVLASSFLSDPCAIRLAGIADSSPFPPTFFPHHGHHLPFAVE